MALIRKDEQVNLWHRTCLLSQYSFSSVWKVRILQRRDAELETLPPSEDFMPMNGLRSTYLVGSGTWTTEATARLRLQS